MNPYEDDPDVIFFPDPEEELGDELGDERVELIDPSDAEEVEELERTAGDLLFTENFLEEIDEALKGRFAGPTSGVKLLALALYSRHLDKPISVVVRAVFRREELCD